MRQNSQDNRASFNDLASTKGFIGDPKIDIVAEDTCLCKGSYLLFVKEDETDMSRWKGCCRELWMPVGLTTTANAKK